MRRAPLLLLSLAALFAAALRPGERPAFFIDAEDKPAREVLRVHPRTMLPTRLDGLPAAEAPAGPPIEVELRLSVDPRAALSPAAGLMPVFDAEAASPMPDELPGDPLIVALDELWAAPNGARAAALDALDLSLVEAPAGGGAWSQAAAAAARRELQAADHADAEASHNAALQACPTRAGPPRCRPPRPCPGAKPSRRRPSSTRR